MKSEGSVGKPHDDPFRRVETGRAPRIWAISDLHLGLGVDKPMDIFGPGWSNHAERIAENWRRVVAPDDLVLIPGDLSWGLKVEQAMPDLNFVEALPGRKIIGKGNHCHWWPKTHAKFDALSFKTMTLAHGVLHIWQDLVLLFVRGWFIKEFHKAFNEKDEVIWQRELTRLNELIGLLPGGVAVIAAVHFPFVIKTREGTLFKTPFHTALVEAGVGRCIYGHLHSDWIARGPNGESIDGVRYDIASVDAVNCTPILIHEPAAAA